MTLGDIQVNTIPNAESLELIPVSTGYGISSLCVLVVCYGFSWAPGFGYGFLKENAFPVGPSFLMHSSR